MNDIHSNIRKYRKEKDMTLEELGKVIKVSKQTVQRYETGEIESIPYKKIVAIADALGISPTKLMGWDDLYITHYEENGKVIYHDSGYDGVQERADAYFGKLIQNRILDKMSKLSKEQLNLIESMIDQMLK